MGSKSRNRRRSSRKGSLGSTDSCGIPKVPEQYETPKSEQIPQNFLGMDIGRAVAVDTSAIQELSTTKTVTKYDAVSYTHLTLPTTSRV